MAGASRRRRGRARGWLRAARLLLTLAVGVAGVLVVRGPGWDAVSDRLDLQIEDTADVDEPHERVAVTSDLGDGVSWTMQGRPDEATQSVPLPGGAISVTLWSTERGRSGEAVGIFPVEGRAFDLDGGLRGSVTNMPGGELGPITADDVAGRPARTAPFVARVDGHDLTGRLLIVDAGATAVMVMMQGDAEHEDAVAEQHRILVESLRLA